MKRYRTMRKAFSIIMALLLVASIGLSACVGKEAPNKVGVGVGDYYKTVRSARSVESNEIHCGNADIKVLSAGTLIIHSGLTCSGTSSLVAESASTLNITGLETGGDCNIHAGSASTIIIKGIDGKGVFHITAKHASTVHVTGEFAQKPTIDKDWSSTVIVN